MLLIAVAKDTPEPVFYRLEVVEGLLAVTGARRTGTSASRSRQTFCGPVTISTTSSMRNWSIWAGTEGDSPLKHFRNDEMLFVFVSRLPIKAAESSEADAKDLAKAVLAYEIAFRELGDMAGDDDD